MEEEAAAAVQAAEEEALSLGRIVPTLCAAVEQVNAKCGGSAVAAR